MMSLKMSSVYFKSEIRRNILICVVCGERARGFNFGAITCMSCKMFFHRNAWNNTGKLQCHRGGNCAINVRTRKYCSSCRILQCFRMGMRKDLIRTQPTRSKSIDDQKLAVTYSPRIPSLDLFQRYDHSSLPKYDWELLRQLSSMFDSFTDHIIFKAGEMHDELSSQAVPPVKMRMKGTYIYDIANIFAAAALDFLKLVPQFLALPGLNQTVLLKRNTRPMIMFYSSYQMNLKIVQKLCRTPYWIASLNCILSPPVREVYYKLVHQIGQLSFLDPCLIKLIIALLVFSSNNIDHDEKIFAERLNEHYHALLLHQIQSFYAELTWKYMIYRFGEDHTIHYYSELIKIILHVQTYVSNLDNSSTSTERKFDDIMEKLTTQIEQLGQET